MVCETCRFTGRPGFVSAARMGSGDSDGGGLIPCPDCGGSGIVHCCDGICEQPELARNATDAGRNNSPGEETIR